MKRYWSKQSSFGKTTLGIALGCAAIVATAVIVSGIAAAMFINRSCSTTEIHTTVCNSSLDVLGIRDATFPWVFSFGLIGLIFAFAHGQSDQLRIARETGEARRATEDKE